MPTSKDILVDAKKELDKHSQSEDHLKELLKTGVADLAAFGKAKAELGTSIGAMNQQTGVLESRLKELIKELAALEKNEPVMKAPADAKVYEALVKAYKAEMKMQRDYQLKLDQLAKSATSHIK
jgi:hypothetical protein